MPCVPVSSVSIGCAAKTGVADANNAHVRMPGSRLELVRTLGKTVRQIRRKLEGLVFTDLVLDRKRCKKTAVDPARDVMSCGNRQERARVVVESDGVVKARRLGCQLAKAQHSLRAVVEPPGRAQLENRIMPRQRRQLARIRRLVEPEQ